MLTTIARLSPVLFIGLSACSTPLSRPAPPIRPTEEISSHPVPKTPTKPGVVTVPVDTGLETAPDKPSSPTAMPEPPAVSQPMDLSRPLDATNSPYPQTGELPPAQPEPESAIDPVLPAIEVQQLPDPGPIRALSPRVGEKLFNQSAPPAVVALEKDIETEFRARHYGDAAAQIDRALRIQPKNAELWHVLAEIRLRQNQPALAEDLAKKSNSLAKSNDELVKSNWRIIADARRQQGDGAGAQDALEKAW